MDTVSVELAGGESHEFSGELVSRVVREEWCDARRRKVSTVSLYRTPEGRFVVVLDKRMVVQSANLFLRFNTLRDVGEYLGRDDGDLARELLSGIPDAQG